MRRDRLQRISVAWMLCGAIVASMPVDPATDVVRADETVPAPAISAAPAAVAEAAAEPAAVDLSHLTFTATGNLSAALIDPAPAAAAPSGATKVTVSTVAGAGVELRVNGTVVPPTRIGERTVNKLTGETRYTYYGVVLEPGPNAIDLIPLGADGLRGAAVTNTLFGPGAPVTLSADLDRALVADGKTAALLTLTALDRWKHPARPGSVVKLSIAAGDAHFLAGKDNTPANALEVPVTQGGVFSVPLVPGLQSGDVRIAVAAGDAHVEATYFVKPNLRAPLVAGLVSVGSGSVPGMSDGDGRYDDGGSRRSRAALYAVGKIAPDTLGSVAYASANTLDAESGTGPQVIDNTDRRYATYGDQSVRRDDALSRERLFARVDRNRSTAMYGEFRADTGGANNVGGYSKLVNGGKVDLTADDNRARVMAFSAKDDVAYARQTFPASGLASSNLFLHGAIIIGSEQVTLVSIDRRTGAVVEQTPLARSVDYTLDDATGALRFITIPLPFDAKFNPQVILVQYEYAGATGGAKTSGGRGELALGRGGRVRLGAGYVNDVSGTGNFSVMQQDLTGSLHGGGWSIVHANSSGVVPSLAVSGAAAGSALRAAYAQSTAADRIALDYTATTPGYADPFGGLSAPGLTDGKIAYAHRLRRGGDVTLAYEAQANRGVAGSDSTQSTASLLVHHVVSSRLALTAGVDVRAQHTGSAVSSAAADALNLGTVSGAGGTSALLPPASVPAPGSGGTATQAQLGAEWKPSKNATVGIARTASFGGQSAAIPDLTTASIAYDMNHRGTLYVRQLWSSAPQQTFTASTSSLSGVAGATRSTAFGIERQIGSATTVDSEYAIERVGTAADVYSSTGVREKLKFGQRVHGDAFVQRANAAGSNAGGFNLFGGSLSYGDGKSLALTAALQSRTGFTPGTSLQLGAGGPLGADVSLLGSFLGTSANGINAVDARAAIAWRPSHSDRGAALLSYERRSGNLTDLGTRTDVLSFESVYRPTHRLELGGRLALKLDGDGFYAAHTALAGLRANQRLGSRLDIGAEIRTTNARNVAGAATTEVAAETGVRLGDKMRLAGGYNFRGSVDPTLVNAPVRRGFYATVTSVVDRLFGWGK